jgi:hypothetical protein
MEKGQSFLKTFQLTNSIVASTVKKKNTWTYRRKGLPNEN